MTGYDCVYRSAVYVQGLGVQPADTEMTEKMKGDGKYQTQKEQAQGDIRPGPHWGCRSWLLCREGCVVTSAACREWVTLGWEPGSELLVEAVVVVKAMKSWKSLALLSVQWNGIFLSLKACWRRVTVQLEMEVEWRGALSRCCELAPGWLRVERREWGR